MVRLTEARARAECRVIATRSDAEDVVALMKFSLWETYEDNTGSIDFQRSQNGMNINGYFICINKYLNSIPGAGMSKKGEPKRFVAHLNRVAKDIGSDKFSYDQVCFN
jgi:DNA helicase MCM8